MSLSGRATYAVSRRYYAFAEEYNLFAIGMVALFVYIIGQIAFIMVGAVAVAWIWFACWFIPLVVSMIVVWLFLDDTSARANAAAMKHSECLGNMAEISRKNAEHNDHH